MNRPGGPAAWLLAAAPLLLAFLLTGSSAGPGAPFSGDNGMKLWQADAFIHGRTTLERSLPAGTGAGEFAPVLSRPAEGGVTSIYPASFPLLTTMFGLGSLFSARLVVLALTTACAWVLAVLAGGGAFAGASAFVLSGLAPYSLVYWEHGPAMLPALLSVVLFRNCVEKPGRHLPWCILPLAAASFWRAEIAVAAAAMAAVMLACSRNAPGAGRGLAALLLLAAAGIVTLLEPGLLPAGVAANLPDLGHPGSFLVRRIDIFQSWTLPWTNLPAVAALVLWAAGAVARARGARGWKSILVCSAGAAVILYYWFRKSVGTSSVFMLTPGLLLLPLAPGWGSDSRARHLVIGALGASAAVLMLSPTDGMFQFGPRFLLLPSALAAAALVSACRNRRGGGAVLLTALLLSLWASVRGVMFQQYFRAAHDRLAASLEQAPEGVVTGTDEEWLPLVAWRVAASRPLLHAGSPSELLDRGMDGFLWMSAGSVAGSETSEPGYRDLRWSGPGAAGLQPPQGDLQPDPWRGVP